MNVKSRLLPILKKYNFEVTEEFKNIIRFQSDNVKINVAFNDRDKSSLIEIGRVGENLFPLNNQAVQELFNSSLALDEVTQEVFIENLCTLFETDEGMEILNGNIASLKKFIESQSQKYTANLVAQQLLKKADIAWESGNHTYFITLIDQMDKDQLPDSYRLKYKIAGYHK